MNPSHRSRFPLILVSDAHFTREHVYSMLHTTSKTSTNEAPFILISDLLLDEIKKPPPPTLSPSRIDGTLKRRKNIMGFADEFISLSRALVLVYTDITPLISSATTLTVQQRHELEQLSTKLMKLITRYETKVAAIQETFFTWKQRSVFYGGLTGAVLVAVAILLLLSFFNASLVDFPTIRSILDATDTTVLVIVGLATAWCLNASLASLEGTQRLLTYFSEYTFRDVMGWLAFHDSLEPFIKSGHSIQNHPFSRNLKEKWVVDSMERAFIYEEEMRIYRNAYGYKVLS